MNSYNSNKNRFRNLYLGLCLSCTVVLWAFNLEQMPEQSVIEIIYDEGEQFVDISSYVEPEVERKELRVQSRVVATPLVDLSKIKLVDPSDRSLTIRSTSLFDLNLSNSRLRPMPQPVKPGGIELRPDVLPSFPGGPEALRRFLETELKYPETCLEQDKTGVVVVRFVVDEGGNISEASIVKDELHCLAADEALKVVGKMPRWTPAKKNGIAVKSYFTQVFRFKMY